MTFGRLCLRHPCLAKARVGSMTRSIVRLWRVFDPV